VNLYHINCMGLGSFEIRGRFTDYYYYCYKYVDNSEV